MDWPSPRIEIKANDVNRTIHGINGENAAVSCIIVIVKIRQSAVQQAVGGLHQRSTRVPRRGRIKPRDRLNESGGCQAKDRSLAVKGVIDNIDFGGRSIKVAVAAKNKAGKRKTAIRTVEGEHGAELTARYELKNCSFPVRAALVADAIESAVDVFHQVPDRIRAGLEFKRSDA